MTEMMSVCSNYAKNYASIIYKGLERAHLLSRSMLVDMQSAQKMIGYGKANDINVIRLNRY